MDSGSHRRGRLRRRRILFWWKDSGDLFSGLAIRRRRWSCSIRRARSWRIWSAGGGATIGTILQIANGSITVQLPTSTSTTATTGTKIVLVGTGTQVEEMQSVPVSSLSVGQTVTVTGTANSDGSVTATSIQVLPAGARRGGTTQTAPTSGQ